MAGGRYIMGPQVQEFEAQFAQVFRLLINVISPVIPALMHYI